MKQQLLPQTDPVGAFQRKATAARRIAGGTCLCGESRPEALNREEDRVICEECKRKEKGMKTEDNHHYAGDANSPITVEVPTNDHLAELTPAQQQWPRRTLQNPQRSPLLAAAASIRGFMDTFLHLVEKALRWIAEMLEVLDEFLRNKVGDQWWIGTPIEKFARKGAAHA